MANVTLIDYVARLRQIFRSVIAGAMVEMEMEMVIGDTVSQIMAPIDRYKQSVFVSTATRCQNIEDGSQVNQAFQWY